jgi:hypothetical protein
MACGGCCTSPPRGAAFTSKRDLPLKRFDQLGQQVRSQLRVRNAILQLVVLLRCQGVFRHNVEVKSSIALDEEDAIRGGVAAGCVPIIAARLHQV